MAVIFVNPSAGKQSAALAQVVAHATKPKKTKRTRKQTNVRPRPLPFSLDQPGRVRVGHWLTLLDIASPTFFAWRKAGKVPAADGHDGRPFWLTSTVKAFLEQPGG